MAIILVSGGLDSATALAWALKMWPVDHHIAISFFYGQRHNIERGYAEKLCEHFGLDQPRNINLAQAFHAIGGSSLTSGVVSGNPSTEEVERTESPLPPSFVPGRNLLFLTVAASIGYVEKDYDIVGGWNAVDYSGYPDCRPSFIKAFETVAMLAMDEPRINVHTPLIHLSKAEIIKLGYSMDVPYRLTYSCYAGGQHPCGECDSCKIRLAGFASLNLTDPTEYRNS